MIKKFSEFLNEGTYDSPQLEESHEDLQNYMFFSNLESIKRKCEAILAMDFKKIDDLLNEGGHDWAADHIAVAKENIDQVEGFLTGHFEDPHRQEPTSAGISEAYKAYQNSTNNELAAYIISLSNELGGEKDPKKIELIKRDLEEVKQELEDRKKNR